MGRRLLFAALGLALATLRARDRRVPTSTTTTRLRPRAAREDYVFARRSSDGAMLERHLTSRQLDGLAVAGRNITSGPAAVGYANTIHLFAPRPGQRVWTRIATRTHVGAVGLARRLRDLSALRLGAARRDQLPRPRRARQRQRALAPRLHPGLGVEWLRLRRGRADERSGLDLPEPRDAQHLRARGGRLRRAAAVERRHLARLDRARRRDLRGAGGGQPRRERPRPLRARRRQPRLSEPLGRARLDGLVAPGR